LLRAATAVNILCQQRNLHDTYTFFSIDPEIGNTLAVVTIRHSKVQIELWEPIHAGTYAVHLFQHYCHNDDACLQGFIRKKKIENHKCSEYLGLFYTFVNRRFVAPAQDQRIICDTSRDGMRLSCNLEVCCPKEILQGDEKFITSMGTFVAILSRGSLANPQEKQSSESPREQKTKLKQHFCMYCGKLKTCLARHLQKVHSDEDQVKNLICLKGREKQKALRSIRLLGDKNYNEKVKPHKRIAVRKPVLQLISESLHCPVCNALIARKNFSKHHLKCSKRAPDYRKRIRQIENEITSKTSLDFDEKLLKQLLDGLQNDEVTDVIKNDRLIQGLGIYMSKSNRTMQQMKNSRTQMRRCARLLLIIRRQDTTVKDFKDCMIPSKYKLIMNAIRVLCEQENTETGTKLKYPTVALQIGPVLSTLISRLRRHYLEDLGLHPSSPELQILERFGALHRTEFAIEITRDALNTANANKFQSKKELPKPADIQKLREYCKKNISRELFLSDKYWI
jgi:hypothetical protein